MTVQHSVFPLTLPTNTDFLLSNNGSYFGRSLLVHSPHCTSLPPAAHAGGVLSASLDCALVGCLVVVCI